MIIKSLVLLENFNLCGPLCTQVPVWSILNLCPQTDSHEPQTPRINESLCGVRARQSTYPSTVELLQSVSSECAAPNYRLLVTVPAVTTFIRENISYSA